MHSDGTMLHQNLDLACIEEFVPLELHTTFVLLPHADVQIINKKIVYVKFILFISFLCWKYGWSGVHNDILYDENFEIILTNKWVIQICIGTNEYK